MKEEDLDFSNLTTVSVFDRGESSCIQIRNHEDVKSCSPSSLLIESLIAELSNFVEEDPQKQKKLYISICRALNRLNLLGKSSEKDDFMRTPYRQALTTLFNLAKITNNVENRDGLVPHRLTAFPLSQVSNDIIKWSRYMLEFEELDYIARGGFGSVFKAKHRLDDNVYAVKKICLNANEVKENIMEVRTLAKLNHPNIVAYKAAWIELMEGRQNVPSIESAKDDSKKSSSKSSSDWIVFEGSLKKSSSEDELSESPSQTCEDKNEGVVCKFQPNNGVQVTYTSATLYIQMQFCQQTLRRWLESRNQQDSLHLDACCDIFKKVVQGVEYIHSQGIVHHDINPNNIFVSEDLRDVQVGDFGLACCILAHQSQTVAAPSAHRKGTYLYAAPEQLIGTCNPKSDIYSLGIVLYELMSPFKTSMERVEMLEQLKCGKIPTDLTAKFPNWAKTISQMVDVVDNRPSASELLSSLDESGAEKSLNEIKTQKEIIRLLRLESLKKDEEIAALKRQIEEFQKTKR